MNQWPSEAAARRVCLRGRRMMATVSASSDSYRDSSSKRCSRATSSLRCSVSRATISTKNVTVSCMKVSSCDPDAQSSYRVQMAARVDLARGSLTSVLDPIESMKFQQATRASTSSFAEARPCQYRLATSRPRVATSGSEGSCYVMSIMTRIKPLREASMGCVSKIRPTSSKGSSMRVSVPYALAACQPVSGCTTARTQISKSRWILSQCSEVSPAGSGPLASPK